MPLSTCLLSRGCPCVRFGGFLVSCGLLLYCRRAESRPARPCALLVWCLELRGKMSGAWC